MQIGDAVMKGSDVLRVVDRRKESVAGGPEVDYWILETAYPNGRTGFTLRVPVDKESELLKPVPSKDDWATVIDKVQHSEKIGWVKDRAKRIEKFHDIVKSGDLVDAIRLERTFREFRQQPSGKLSMRDRDFESKANNFVTSAAAASFDMTPDEASRMLEDALA